MSSSRGPVHSGSSRLGHGPHGLTPSLTRNTCLIWALALSSADSASFVCGAGVLSAPICILEFLGMFCHLCFWTRYPWARFWVQLEFFIFFFSLWREPGKIQKLWHRNEASEWVTGHYTHHRRKPVQEKGDTAWTPRWMQPVSLKQTKSYPSLHIILCCLRDPDLCFCHLQPTGFNGLLSDSVQNSFSPNPLKLLPLEAKTLFLLAGLPDNHGWCLFSAGKGP